MKGKQQKWSQIINKQTCNCFEDNHHLPSSTFFRPTLFQNRKGSSITDCEVHSTQDGFDVCDLGKVKVIEAGSATWILILFPCFLHCSPQHSTLCAIATAWRSESLHFLVFLNALIDREYPGCQSQRGSCPRLGGDCCGSTEASSLVILLACRRCYLQTS